MQQGNIGSVKKKDVEGQLGWISAQMPLVHVVQRNVKKRIDSRHPFYPCGFLLRAQNAKKSTYF